MYSLNVNNKNYQEQFKLFPFSNSVENILVFPAWAKIPAIQSRHRSYRAHGYQDREIAVLLPEP